MNIKTLILPAVVAGIVFILAACAPAHDRFPAPPAAVVTTEAPDATHLAPRCFETSTAGAQDCVWAPVGECLSEEDGDEDVPAGYDGCYWDAANRGNHAGAGYVYWRLNRG